MKIFTWICIVLCLALLLTGCQWEDGTAEELLEIYNGFVEELGQLQLTGDKSLIGKRTPGQDDYTGVYTADCLLKTGRDVAFGGASIQNRSLRCSGRVDALAGEALIRVRKGSDVTYLETDSSGRFDTVLDLESGGNYIMVDYDHFCGKVEMTCEYDEG